MNVLPELGRQRKESTAYLVHEIGGAYVTPTEGML